MKLKLVSNMALSVIGNAIGGKLPVKEDRVKSIYASHMAGYLDKDEVIRELDKLSKN